MQFPQYTVAYGNVDSDNQRMYLLVFLFGFIFDNFDNCFFVYANQPRRRLRSAKTGIHSASSARSAIRHCRRDSTLR